MKGSNLGNAWHERKKKGLNPNKIVEKKLNILKVLSDGNSQIKLEKVGKMVSLFETKTFYKKI